MLKADAIKRIKNDVIAPIILKLLEQQKFKFVKTKQSFIRKEEIFEHHLFLNSGHSPLEYREDIDEIRFNFELLGSLLSPKMDKWIKEKLEERSYFRHPLSQIKSYIVLDFDFFNNEDFADYSKSQLFKRAVTASLVGPDNELRAQIDQLSEQIENVLNEFETFSDPLKLTENPPPAWRNYGRLLAFSGNLEQAKELYSKTYSNFLEKLNSNSNDQKDLNDQMNGMELFTKEAKILLDLDLDNPLERKFISKQNESSKLKLTENLGFEESFRIDTSMYRVYTHKLNKSNELLCLLEKNKIVKLNSNGEIQFEHEIKLSKEFKPLNTASIHFLEELNSFQFNNLVIQPDNSIIEIKYPFEIEGQKKESLEGGINDLKFDKANEQFLMLSSPKKDEHLFSKHDMEGNVLEVVKLPSRGVETIPEIERVFVGGEKNSLISLDFKAQEIAEHKYGNGNDRFQVSKDGKHLVCHFYSTKSQYFNLEKGTEKALWAHPTYLKGYKEEFYNDIHHNFGLTTTKFSPDNKYLVGGADHGKYVAWTLDNLERIELIPNEEIFDLFQSYYTRIDKSGNSEKVYHDTRVVDHEGTKLFINRGYDIIRIYFLEEGNYFLTQIGKHILVWSNEFEHINTILGVGVIENYLNESFSVQRKNEIVVYNRVDGIDDKFESTVFEKLPKKEVIVQENKQAIEPVESETKVKEVEPQDSNIRVREDLNEPVKKMEEEQTKVKKSFFQRLFSKN